jgi:hypothetical protein
MLFETLLHAYKTVQDYTVSQPSLQACHRLSLVWYTAVLWLIGDLCLCCLLSDAVGRVETDVHLQLGGVGSKLRHVALVLWCL